jgi:hypothetical protein
MRVYAQTGECEFRHIGAADQYRAGRPQARHGRRVGAGGLGVLQDNRSGGRDLAGKVEQVLDRNGETRERGGDDAVGAQTVAGFGLSQSGAAIDVGEDPGALPRRVGDAVERRFGQGGAGGAARRQIGGPRCDGRCLGHLCEPSPGSSGAATL